MKEKDKAVLINAINNTLVLNKKAGTYTNLEALCVDKLTELIKSINVKSGQ